MKNDYKCAFSFSYNKHYCLFKLYNVTIIHYNTIFVGKILRSYYGLQKKFL